MTAVLDQTALKPGTPKFSEIIEEYCEAIYNLASEEGKVKSSRLAERMRVTPPTVSVTLQRLQRDGLPVIESGSHLVQLTAAGEKVALNLNRRHGLLEDFLFYRLGLEWDEVHDEACRLECTLSEKVEAALDALLGHPKTCPHGNVIFGNGYELPPDACTVTEYKVGTRLQFVQISEEGEHQTGLLKKLN